MSGEARGVWHRVKREAEQQAGRLTRGNKAPRHSPESSCSHPLATTPVAAAAPSDDSSGSGEAGAYTRSVHTRHAVLACGERQPPPHQLSVGLSRGNRASGSALACARCTVRASGCSEDACPWIPAVRLMERMHGTVYEWVVRAAAGVVTDDRGEGGGGRCGGGQAAAPRHELHTRTLHAPPWSARPLQRPRRSPGACESTPQSPLNWSNGAEPPHRPSGPQSTRRGIQARLTLGRFTGTV